LRIANAVSARRKRRAVADALQPVLLHAGSRGSATSAKALFAAIRKGVVTPEIGQTYALKDAARAQADLEARKTTGTTLLVP
jgi:NADPH:quinone reductase-like Zn-dependent oxidoreductase